MKNYKNFLNESSNDLTLYRNTNIEWLISLLKDKEIRNDFISFSYVEDSGGNDFGNARITFNGRELEKQGLIDIDYSTDFFKENPDISEYVTDYRTEKDFHDNIVDGDWEDHIIFLKDEEELVIKDILKFTNNLIENVEIDEDIFSNLSQETIDLFRKNNITYEKKY